MRIAALLAAALAFGWGVAVAAGEPIPPPEELEARGAIIGNILVNPQDIFDTSIPGERGWLYRAANKLHIETRPSVIRGQLLFKTGDPYQQRLLQETERILRSRNYLYDASIVPVAFDGHTVDLLYRLSRERLQCRPQRTAKSRLPKRTGFSGDAASWTRFGHSGPGPQL